MRAAVSRRFYAPCATEGIKLPRAEYLHAACACGTRKRTAETGERHRGHRDGTCAHRSGKPGRLAERRIARAGWCWLMPVDGGGSAVEVGA